VNETKAIKPVGRPTKRTPETEKKILDILRAGNTRKTAYSVVGVSDTAFANWLNNLDFLEAVKKAEEEAVARNVAVINQAAQKSWQAAAWWLERKRPEEWRERKSINLSELSDDKLIALLESEAGS
jgi:transposase